MYVKLTTRRRLRPWQRKALSISTETTSAGLLAELKVVSWRTGRTSMTGRTAADFGIILGMKVCLITFATLLAGCSSVSVGMPVPVPGPVKPHVGATLSKSGVSGHAGASARVGKQPIYVGGTSDTIKLKKKTK